MHLNESGSNTQTLVSQTHDVVIVGGGPAGLFLACELQLSGVRPLVLERLTAPDLTDKAHGLAGQIVRLLDHRGLFERCGGSGDPEPAHAFFFGALPLPLHALGRDNPMYLLRCYQRDLEASLSGRADELGVQVLRGWEMRGLAQTPDVVHVTAQSPDGQEHTLTARYLVGCDGGRSGVRKALGIEFPGVRDEHVVDRSAIVAASDQLRVLPGGRAVVAGREMAAGFNRTERGTFAVVPHDPSLPIVHTTEWEAQPAGNSPGPGSQMTLAEMEDSIERVLGVRVTLVPPPAGSPTLVRRLCGRNTRVADRYRVGRAFVAGDAAHISYGPTLNLALQDAINLGWKLAATLKGWAPSGLLNTYESERRASALRVLMATKSESALEAPGPEVTALRDLFAEILSDAASLLRVAALMAGSDVRYDMGDAAPAMATGWFVPPMTITTTDGRSCRVAEVLRDGRPLLLDFSGGGDLGRAVQPWTPRVSHVAGVSADAPAPALLVRPDGYVAWAGADPETLTTALQRWFGAA